MKKKSQYKKWKICPICKKKFFANKDCKTRNQKFCSIKCFGLSIAKIKKCKNCGKEFYNYANKYFCSMKCAGEYKRGKKLSKKHIRVLSKVKKGKPIKHFIENQKEISEKISKALLGKPRFKSRGRNHPNWKGGITKLNWQIRNSLKYKNWRRMIFKRDNYICQICKKRGGEIHADHKKKFAQILFENKIISLKEALNCKELWELENGRTLCRKCHLKTDTWGGGKFYNGRSKKYYFTNKKAIKLT